MPEQMFPKLERKPYKNGVVIFDFDGCISICNWRQATLPANSDRKNYDDFHELSIYDPPNEWIVNIMCRMKILGVKVVILTGRMDANLRKSTDWLNDHGVPYDWIQMRADNDYRPSALFKAEYIAKFYKEEIKMIFDDNSKVIEHLSSLGYPTFKVKAEV
jgi:hypothetical protein